MPLSVGRVMAPAYRPDPCLSRVAAAPGETFRSSARGRWIAVLAPPRPRSAAHPRLMPAGEGARRWFVTGARRDHGLDSLRPAASTRILSDGGAVPMYQRQAECAIKRKNTRVHEETVALMRGVEELTESFANPLATTQIS